MNIVKPPVESIRVLKVSQSGSDSQSDLLAVEEPLEIRLGFGLPGDRSQRSLAVTMRTPGHDFELTSGFLITEGIISSFDQIESIKYCEDLARHESGNIVRVELKSDVSIQFDKLQRNFYTTSSCGVCGKSSIDSVRTTCTEMEDGFLIESGMVCQLPDKLRSSQHVFEFTGGLHAVGLFDRTGSQILLREDVGRHNAFDKIIGAMASKGKIPLSDCVAFVSGRASFELVQKAVMAGIPVLAAVGAPSSLAVSLAKEFNCTLLGFVRDSRFNVYTCQHRIITAN